MQYIKFETSDGKNNMQKDSDLLDFAIKTKNEESFFRLYSWAPACVSLGRNQTSEFLDLEYLKARNIDIVRRLTGGRALLHDKELTYSYICPVKSLNDGGNIMQSYKEICEILIKAFDDLGIELDYGEKKPSTKFDYCMSVSTGADLGYLGKKLIGSAQYRKEGYILQHGSILFDYDANLIEKIFGEKVDSNSITTVKEIAPDLSIEKLVEAFERVID